MGSGEPNQEFNEIAKPYRDVMDFAFFVANFNYSKADYENLTPTEKVFIYKAWETKIVEDTTFINNAIANAIANTNRKKGKKWMPLWRKKPKAIDAEKVVDDMKRIREIEKHSNKDWVTRIHEANGLTQNKKGGGLLGRLYSKRQNNR